MNIKNALLPLLLGGFISQMAQAANICVQSRITTPDSDFTVDSVNEVVTHHRTGLMWENPPQPIRDTWSAALIAADNSTHAGYTDWRLPNVEELSSMLDLGCYPAYNSTVFTGVGWFTWTSTLDPNTPSSVWILDTIEAALHLFTVDVIANYRLVRDAQ